MPCIAPLAHGKRSKMQMLLLLQQHSSKSQNMLGQASSNNVCGACVGNIRFLGLSVAQEMGREMVEGTVTLKHNRGSLEGCDFL